MVDALLRKFDVWIRMKKLGLANFRNASKRRMEEREGKSLAFVVVLCHVS